MDLDANLEEAAELTMDLVRDAHARAKEQLKEGYELPARRVDAVLAFTRLVRTLRQLRKQDAKPAAKPGRTAAAPAAPADPRHALVREQLHRAVAKNPDKRSLQRDIDRTLDEFFPADPDTKPLDIFDAVCRELAIPIDHSKVSDQLLGMPPRIYPPRDVVPPLDPDRFTVIPLPLRTD